MPADFTSARRLRTRPLRRPRQPHEFAHCRHLTRNRPEYLGPAGPAAAQHAVRPAPRPALAAHPQRRVDHAPEASRGSGRRPPPGAATAARPQITSTANQPGPGGAGRWESVAPVLAVAARCGTGSRHMGNQARADGQIDRRSDTRNAIRRPAFGLAQYHLVKPSTLSVLGHWIGLLHRKCVIATMPECECPADPPGE